MSKPIVIIIGCLESYEISCGRRYCSRFAATELIPRAAAEQEGQPPPEEKPINLLKLHGSSNSNFYHLSSLLFCVIFRTSTLWLCHTPAKVIPKWLQRRGSSSVSWRRRAQDLTWLSGQWRSASDNGKTKDRLKYHTDLAKLAEKGKISCIFLADWYVGFDVYNDSLDTMLKAGHQVAHLDPVPIISAMAAVTVSVSFAATVSTSYVNPYILARQFSTLDHLTEGRVGWNIVTSYTKGAAKALGYDEVVPHDERYLVADEYMEVVYKLWESSWAPDSVVWSDEVAYDPIKIKKIEHKGKYFQTSGRSQVHPSPQRTPVLFQAGTSKSGTAFAGRHAEAMFLNPCTVKQGKKVIAEARVAAAAEGRDPQSLKFFPCIMPIIGHTEEEAQAKYEKAKSHADIIGGLAQFSGYTGIDMSNYPLDEPFSSSTLKGGAGIQSVLNSFEASTESTEPWTPRRLGLRMALGGLHPCLVGSITQVADVFEEWVNEADCDGFNVGYYSNPGSFEDVVELLRPELVRRGMLWEDYDFPGGTFRENLLGQKFLREDHYGSKFKYGREYSKTTEEVHKPEVAPVAEAQEQKILKSIPQPVAA